MSIQQPPQQDFFKMVQDSIKGAIQKHVEVEFEAFKVKLIADLESRKNEICAGIMLDLTKSVEFERMGQTVTIRIREITK